MSRAGIKGWPEHLVTAKEVSRTISRGGEAITPDYSTMENWRERANARKLVLTRSKSVHTKGML